MLPDAKPLAGRSPNIVMLFADDLGYQDLGCYEGFVKTSVKKWTSPGSFRRKPRNRKRNC